MDKSKLDPNTRKQLKDINQDSQIAEIITAVNDLKARVTTLEQARTVQRQLNKSFETGMRVAKKALEPVEKESLWDKILNAIGHGK